MGNLQPAGFIVAADVGCKSVLIGWLTQPLPAGVRADWLVGVF